MNYPCSSDPSRTAFSRARMLYILRSPPHGTVYTQVGSQIAPSAQSAKERHRAQPTTSGTTAPARWPARQFVYQRRQRGAVTPADHRPGGHACLVLRGRGIVRARPSHLFNRKQPEQREARCPSSCTRARTEVVYCTVRDRSSLTPHAWGRGYRYCMSYRDARRSYRRRRPTRRMVARAMRDCGPPIKNGANCAFLGVGRSRTPAPRLVPRLLMRMYR